MINLAAHITTGRHKAPSVLRRSYLKGYIGVIMDKKMETIRIIGYLLGYILGSYMFEGILWADRQRE